MRKQNVRLLSEDGSFTVRHLTPTQAQELVDRQQARIVSRSPMRIRLVAQVSLDGGSKPSKAMLGAADVALLGTLKKGFVERLDAARVADMRPSTIAGLQRLRGWNLIPACPALENFEA